MNSNEIIFCNTCGNMKIITYKYIANNLHINCICKKENKKRCYPIELFLKNDYKSNPNLKCNVHNLPFSYWCNDCNFNICEKCLQMHKNHKIIKLSTLLVDNNDIISLQNKIINFKAKLNEKKKKIEEKKLFNQKEENEFLNNFHKYYKLNINEINFVLRIKDLYLNLLKHKMICYQIIINLKYLIEKLNFISDSQTELDSLKNQNNNGEMDDIFDIYFIVFNIQQYSLLPNNDKEENQKEAEEKQKTILLERSQVLSPDVLSELDNSGILKISIENIPLTESIKVDEDEVKAKSLNALNFMFQNQSNPFDNNKINNSNENNNKSSLIDSDTDSEACYCLLKSQTLPQANLINQNQQNNKPKYYGLFKDGKYHGDRCILYYPNGFVYEGSFREGLRHGTGTLKNDSFSYFYQGGWSKDKKNGKCIEIVGGEKFEGYYKNDVREGKCVITNINNKDKFEGNLIDGKKDGYGEQFYSQTNTIYKGEFKNNVYEGKGELINNNGYYFKGEFLGGLRHGDNCIEEKKGFKKYVGQFRRDKMNGQGTFEWYSGESKGDIYSGEFKDDLFEGFGTYHCKDGSIYKGEYLHGVKHGKGKEIYIDGSFYEGEYNEGVQSGKGIFQDLEGNIYDGNFYNGKKHSKGKIIFSNGEILEGLWLNGLKEGHFYFTDVNGYQYLRKYVKDELIEETKIGFFSSLFNNVFDKISSFIK